MNLNILYKKYTKKEKELIDIHREYFNLSNEDEKIKKVTGVNHVFKSVMFCIGEEKGNLLWNYIKDNCL